jgi:hypothetical protein
MQQRLDGSPALGHVLDSEYDSTVETDVECDNCGERGPWPPYSFRTGTPSQYQLVLCDFCADRSGRMGVH